MTFNYRVVRDRWGEYYFYEVYYDGDGKISGFVDKPLAPFGDESIEDLKEDLDLMYEALKKPVIDLEVLTGEWEE